MARRHAFVMALWGLALVGGAPAAAGPPPTLSYQGVLTDANGVVVPNGTYGLLFEVFQGSSGGTAVFSQALSVVVTDGLYNVLLSTHGVMPYDLEAAFDDANEGRYMQVTIQSSPDPGMPVPLELSPRQEIASVPYALHASTLSLPPIPTREVHFVSSTNSSTSIGDAWTVLRNSTDTDDLEIAVTVASPDCTIEISGSAYFANISNNNSGTLLMIAENGSRVGIATVTDRDQSVWNEYVNPSPSQSTYTYVLHARKEATGGTIKQGGSLGGDPMGAALKVVLACDG